MNSRKNGDNKPHQVGFFAGFYDFRQSAIGQKLTIDVDRPKTSDQGVIARTIRFLLISGSPVSFPIEPSKMSPDFRSRKSMFYFSESNFNLFFR
jgi:hypothetical protein